MNRQTFLDRHASDREALQARFGLRVAARLAEGAEACAPDITERLRFAREQALQRAQTMRRSAAAPAAVAAGPQVLMLAGGSSDGSWWFKLASLLPLAVLVAGLAGIHDLYESAQINAAAQIDAELLADDLPPAAYADPGFAEYLRSPPPERGSDE